MLAEQPKYMACATDRLADWADDRVRHVAQAIKERVSYPTLDRNIDRLIRDATQLTPTPLEWRSPTSDWRQRNVGSRRLIFLGNKHSGSEGRRSQSLFDSVCSLGSRQGFTR